MGLLLCQAQILNHLAPARGNTREH